MSRYHIYPASLVEQVRALGMADVEIRTDSDEVDYIYCTDTRSVNFDNVSAQIPAFLETHDYRVDSYEYYECKFYVNDIPLYPGKLAEIIRFEGGKDRVVETLRPLYAAVNKKIVATSGLSDAEDSSFAIKFNCSHTPTREEDTPETIWGYGTSGYKNKLPSGEGIPLMDTETGFCLAELFPDKLYIHFDIIRMIRRANDMERYYGMFAQLIELTVDQLTLTEEERAAKEAARLEEINEATRQLFARAVSVRHRRLLNNSRRDAGQVKREILETRQRLQALLLKQQKLEQQIMRLESNDVPVDDYLSEYDRIKSQPKIEKVIIVDNRISIETVPLFCKDKRNGAIHRIGKMEISILTGQRRATESLLFRCLEGKQASQVGYGDSDRPAPHVISRDDKGNDRWFACLGNATDTVVRLYGAAQYEELLYYGIAFCESANINDSAGSDVKFWPVASAEELIGTEWEGQQISAAELSKAA